MQDDQFLMQDTSLSRFSVIALLLGATMWGVIWYPLRLLEAEGLYGIWLTFAVYLAAVTVSLPLALRCRREFREHWRILVPLAVTGGCTNVAFILAVLDGNVMRVLLLFYLSPLWTVILGWLLLGERASMMSLATLMLAMSGAVAMLWNPIIGAPWPQTHADWLAIVAGLAFAASNVLVRKGQQISITAKSAVTWFGVVVLAGGLIVSLGLPMPGVSVAVAVGAGALGVFGILVMNVLVQYGVSYMPVHRSAVILLFELVAGAVSQQLLTDEILSQREWIGGAIIVIAAYLSARL